MSDSGDAGSAAPTTTKTYTLAEVAEHNKNESCWIIIHDKVYDVSKFLDEHPGGEEVLLEQGGKVATESFEDVGHSTDARELMKQYCIGEICEAEKQKTKERPLQWDKEPAAESSWSQWLLPMGVAIIGSVLFRLYMARDSS
jgi:cytochrome b involved in lipid metabolism